VKGTATEDWLELAHRMRDSGARVVAEVGEGETRRLAVTTGFVRLEGRLEHVAAQGRRPPRLY
jgi:hypothetical protein